MGLFNRETKNQIVEEEKSNEEQNFDNRILFATIVNRNKVGACLRLLKSDYNVCDKKVFILNNKEDKSKLILTYNIENIEGEDKVKFDDCLKNTFNVHRKKQTNTLYTINALNRAIEKGNGNMEWEIYENSLLLTRKDETGNKKLVQIHTSLNNVVNLEKVKEQQPQK